jgi:hypothetical protein
MTETLLQNVYRMATFEPIDREPVAQMMEGKGPEILILFLGLPRLPFLAAGPFLRSRLRYLRL